MDNKLGQGLKEFGEVSGIVKVVAQANVQIGNKAGEILLLLALFFALLMPQEPYAFELFGVHLWGKKNAETLSKETIGEPKYYQVTVKAALGSDEAGIALVDAASQLVHDADKPASGAAGLLVKARGDYRRILNALYDQGRYGGSISITINGQEAADMAVDSALPEHSTIVITIDQGAVYRFSQALIRDVAPLYQEKKQNLPQPVQKGFASGEIARSSTILQAEKLAIEGWRRLGFAKAHVTARHVVADHIQHTIEAEIDIDPGVPAHYGSLAVRNTSQHPKMDEDYIAWMINLSEGEAYDPAEVERAQKRLTRLEVFRSVSIQEAEEMAQDGSLPLTLMVQERAPRRFGVGASFATIDGATLEGYWLHRNLGGHAERLRFDGKISGVGGQQNDSFNPENYSYLLSGSFIRPGTITPNSDFIANLKAQRNVLDHYTATGLYLQTGFHHLFSDTVSSHFLLNSSVAEIEDNFFGKRQFSTISLSGSLVYDSRDNKNNSKDGFYAEANFEPIYEAKYDNVIAKTVLEGRAYHKIDKQGRFVVAGRARLGSITGADAHELPSNMLFFAGGGGSVRGFGYRNIGIKTSSGTMIGGRSLVEGGLELRTQVTQSVGVVNFVDAGQVGNESYPDFSDPIKWGVGLGVRYDTSLGPLRFDVAHPLKGEAGDPDLGFYIGLGQAF